MSLSRLLAAISFILYPEVILISAVGIGVKTTGYELAKSNYEFKQEIHKSMAWTQAYKEANNIIQASIDGNEDIVIHEADSVMEGIKQSTYEFLNLYSR